MTKFTQYAWFLMLALFTTPTLAQESPGEPKNTANSEIRRTIAVSGDAKLEIIPDLARFSAAIRTTDPDANQATKITAEASNQIMNLLKEAGIGDEDISTQGVQLDLIYGEKSMGFFGTPERYQSSNTIEITVRDLERLPELLSQLPEAGANDIGNLRFDISNRKEREDEVMLLAVDDAFSTASQIATRTEMELIKPIKIEFGDRAIAYAETPVVMEAAMDGAAGSKSNMMAISPGKITLRSHIQILYEAK